MSKPMIYYDEAATITDDQMAKISKHFKKGSTLRLVGFFQHTPGTVVARVAGITSPSKADGSFTVSLKDIKPEGRKALGL